MNWTCLSSCPNGYYANQNNSKCVQICDSIAGMYALDNSNVCVMECPYPYRGYAPNHTCILSCPTLYFYDSIINVCTRCPLQCSACTSLTMCVSCQPGYNLFNGACSLNCRPNNGIITYADPSTNNCVQVCAPPYFGDNSSYACISVCPTKQYGDSSLHLCQNCPQTCSQCTNLTFCTSC
jgi:proprotein convertase subtilisin/kexin type 5